MLKLFSKKDTEKTKTIEMEPGEIVRIIRSHLLVWGFPHKTVNRGTYLYAAVRENEYYDGIGNRFIYEYFVLDRDIGGEILVEYNNMATRIVRVLEFTPEIVPVEVWFFQRTYRNFGGILSKEWKRIDPALGLFELKDEGVLGLIDVPVFYIFDKPKEEFFWKKNIHVKIYYTRVEEEDSVYLSIIDEKRGLSVYFKAGRSVDDAHRVLAGIKRLRIVAEASVLEL